MDRVFKASIILLLFFVMVGMGLTLTLKDFALVFSKPKGVITCHGQNIRTFETWSATVGLRSDDNYLIINPFFHSFGYKAGWLAAIIRGAHMLPVKSFDLDEVLAGKPGPLQR